MRENIDTYTQSFADWSAGERYAFDEPFVITTGRSAKDTVQQKQLRSSVSGFGQYVKTGKLLPPLPYTHFSSRASAATSGDYSEFQEYWDAEAGVYRSFQKLYRKGLVNLPGNDAADTLLADVQRRVESKAITSLLNRAKDSKFNAAVAYAESGQVLKMVTSAATTIGEVLYHLRRGNLVGAADTVGLVVGKRQATRYRKLHANIKTNQDVDRVLSNGILQVQYGIKPLISDVIGAAEMLAQKVSREVISSVRSSASVSEDKRTIRITKLPLGRSTQSLDRRVKVTVSYGCYYSLRSEMTHSLAQLGLTNPFLVAWELVPWSFVVDWFIPIGNAISSWDATLGLSFSSGWKSVKVSNHFTRSTSLSPLHPRNFFAGGGFTYGDTESFVRTTLTGFPSPKLPEFKNPLSVEHALNAIALLAGFKKTAYFEK